MKILSINKHYGFLFFTLALLFFTTGCQRTKKNPLEGTWSSNNTVAIFSDDGEFSLQRGAMISKGTYESLASRNSIVLSYVYGRAQRRMLTSYSISEDGNTLAMNRTCFGTIVLQKQFATPSIKPSRTTNYRSDGLSEFDSLTEFESTSFANGRQTSEGPGNKAANAPKSNGKDSSSDTALSANQFSNRERPLEFQFPTTKKRLYETNGTHPDPNLWPTLGLATWVAYRENGRAG